MKDNLVLGPAWSSLGNGILESMNEDPVEAGSVD
jgi:hypothetical protein